MQLDTLIDPFALKTTSPPLVVSGTEVILTVPLAANYGGTGQSAYAVGDLLYASAITPTLSKLSFVATTTRYLANTGGGATIPEWNQVNLANGVTGTLPYNNGGSGQSSLWTLNGIVYASSTSVLANSSALTFDGTNLVTTGSINIGTTAVAGRALNALLTVANPSASVFAMRFQPTATCTADNTRTLYGFAVYPSYGSAFDLGGLTGFFSSPQITHATATNVISQVACIQTQPDFSGSGTTTACYGVVVSDPAYAGTAVITTLYGIRILAQTARGGAAWNLHVGAGNSAFAGNTTFGAAATPTNAISLSAASKIDFRANTQGIYSQAVGYLDIFGATALRIGNSSAGAPTTYVSIEPDGDTYWTGDGSGLPFGHMYLNTDRTVPVAIADTWYEVDVAAPDFIAGELNEVTFTDHYLAIGIAGRYEIIHHADLETTTAGDELASTVMVNGVATETAHGHATMSTGNSAVATMGVTILDLAATNQISLAIKNHSAVRDVIVTHAQISLKMIGGT